MNITFQDFDRVQFRLAQAEDTIKRLLARVTALEGGEPLPPEPKVQIVPTLPTPAPEPERIQIQTDKPITAVELDLLGGMLMPTGPLRK